MESLTLMEQVVHDCQCSDESSLLPRMIQVNTSFMMEFSIFIFTMFCKFSCHMKYSSAKISNETNHSVYKSLLNSANLDNIYVRIFCKY
jgi:hypothetical protein